MDSKPPCPEVFRPYEYGMGRCRLHGSGYICDHELRHECTDYDRWLEEECDHETIREAP